jgi:Spy/CpxP family protein refolding chaperone
MKTINLSVFAILMAGIIILGTNPILAQKGRNFDNNQGGAGKYCNLMDLTEAQQKKIDELRTLHQKNMLQHRNQLAEKNARLQTLRTAEKADMTAINKTIDEIGTLKTQMMKERENHIQQIRGQLTDSQKVQFDSKAGKGGRGYPNCGARMGQKGGRGFGYGLRGNW